MLTASYGKNYGYRKCWQILAADVKKCLQTSKNKVYRKRQQIDPTLDPQGITRALALVLQYTVRDVVLRRTMFTAFYSYGMYFT